MMKLDAIAETFILLLKEYPYSKVTIKMICEKTPVNRNSFYYHFENKEKLVEWICQCDFLKHSLPYFHLKTDNIATKSFFNYIKTKKDFYNTIANVNQGQLLQKCLIKAYSLSASTKFITEYGNLVPGRNPKIDVRIYHRYAAAGIASVVLFWIEQGMQIPVDEIAKDLYIMLTKSLEEVRDKHLF